MVSYVTDILPYRERQITGSPGLPFQPAHRLRMDRGAWVVRASGAALIAAPPARSANRPALRGFKKPSAPSRSRAGASASGADRTARQACHQSLFANVPILARLGSAGSRSRLWLLDHVA